jgi:hypothetical protein
MILSILARAGSGGACAEVAPADLCSSLWQLCLCTMSLQAVFAGWPLCSWRNATVLDLFVAHLPWILCLQCHTHVTGQDVAVGLRTLNIRNEITVGFFVQVRDFLHGTARASPGVGKA